MSTIAAVLLSTTLAAIGALHLFWAFGGRRASDAVVPTRPAGLKGNGELVFDPGRFATIAVAVFLLVASSFPLGAAGLIKLPISNGFLLFGNWSLGAVLLIRGIGDFRYVGFFKRVRGTRFSELDSRFYSPLCLTLAVLAFYIANTSP